MTAYDEQRLAELIKALPPAPQAWVEAAQELPLARERLDDIVARAEADLAFRDALIADLEATLKLEGYEPGRSRSTSCAAASRAERADGQKKGPPCERPVSREVPACCGLTSEPVPVFGSFAARPLALISEEAPRWATLTNVA